MITRYYIVSGIITNLTYIVNSSHTSKKMAIMLCLFHVSHREQKGWLKL